MSSWDFTALPTAQPDPLFGVAAQAKAAGPQAIDGTIGVYMDEEGYPVVLPSVKMALQELAVRLPDLDYSYPPLVGLPEYRKAVLDLIFDDPSSLHISGIASTAGTGALAMNLRLIRLMQPDTTVILPVPAWANHPPLITANLLPVKEVPYIGDDGAPGIDGLEQACRQTKTPVALLLQVGCHNPTGLDFSDTQWQQIAAMAQKYDCLVFLDFAYQGFKDTPEEDRKVINYFVHTSALLVAWSASKNHSIYGMRCGFACAVVPTQAARADLDILYSRITRGLHSAAPTFGQMIVTLIQEKYRDQWLTDIAQVRSTLIKKRTMLRNGLPERFQASLLGFGMFAMLPLHLDEIKRLRENHKIFLTNDGRINIAGIPYTKIDQLCERIRKVQGKIDKNQ